MSRRGFLALQIGSAVAAVYPLLIIATILMNNVVVKALGWDHDGFLLPYLLLWLGIICVGEVVVIAVVRQAGKRFLD